MNTPRNSRSRVASRKTLKHTVVVSGFEPSGQDIKTIKSYCERLIEADDDISSMTLLIASDEAGGCEFRPRTLKSLAAFSLGVPIVDKRWITQSKECGHVLPIENFRVDSKEAEKEHSFSLQKTLQNGTAARQKGGILRGFDVYICSGGTLFKREKLKILLNLLGAELLSQPSQLEDVKNPKKLIIIEGSNTPRNREIIKNAQSCQAKTVTHDEFLDVVMNQDPSRLQKLPTVYEEGPVDTAATHTNGNSGPIDDAEQTSSNKSVQKDDLAKKSKTRRGKKEKVGVADKSGKSTQTLTRTASQAVSLQRLTLNGPNPKPIDVDILIIGLDGVTLHRSTSQGMDRTVLVGRGRFEVRQKGSKCYGLFVDNKETTIVFQAKIPPQDKLHDQVQGNAGHDPTFFWEALNTAGQSIIYRRYFFQFENVGALTLAIHYMAGCNTDISAKEFFDKNGRFFANEYTRPAHVMKPADDDMEVEDNVVTRDRYYSNGEEEDLFDNDPYAETQQF